MEQLGAQYPGSDWSGLLEQTHSQSAVVEAANYESEETTRTLAYSDVALSEKLRQDTAAEAAGCSRRIAARDGEPRLERMMEVSRMLPLLIVLDTFEEVQKRGIEMARILWRFLGALQTEFPRVRIVVSGRAPVPELAEYLASPEPLPLKEFDESSAIAFLMDRGTPTEEIARAHCISRWAATR